jgi:hypothetical protein
MLIANFLATLDRVFPGSRCLIGKAPPQIFLRPKMGKLVLSYLNDEREAERSYVSGQ